MPRSRAARRRRATVWLTAGLIVVWLGGNYRSPPPALATDAPRVALPSPARPRAPRTAAQLSGPTEAASGATAINAGAAKPYRTKAAADSPSRVEMISATPTGTQLRFVLGSYAIEASTYRGRAVSIVSQPGAHALNARDQPALPYHRRNIVLPRTSAPVLRVVAVEYTDVACAPPLPAAGFVSRSEATEAPGFGAAYQATAPYPDQPVRVTEPFMIREVRGLGVVIVPFQWQPDQGTMRIYQQVDLEIENVPLVTAADAQQSPQLPGSPDAVLVIAPDAWLSSLGDFVRWKRRRGLAVSVAGYPSATGEGPAAIAGSVQAAYRAQHINALILVGDHEDVPVFATSPHPTDTLYTLVSGDDFYHDLLVSRVSANSAAAAAGQLRKFIDYERSPTVGAADWYTRACLVGSNEGAAKSAFGLHDREVLDAQRLRLLDYGYSQVDQIYDPGATAAAVLAAWNQGRGLVCYLGHGTETAWSTSGLDITAVTSGLANGQQLPIVLHGNCKNGNFTRSGGDCLAEAMLKVGTAGQSAGAVGAIAATTAMDWDPPIVMVEAFVEYLTQPGDIDLGDDLSTLGSLTIRSVQRAMDYCYATPQEGSVAAERIMAQTHLLGDCTLGARTTAPRALQVDHATLVISRQAFPVTVSTASGPLAGVSVTLDDNHGQVVYGRTDAAGIAALPTAVLSGETVVLTVYEHNAQPYQVELRLTSGELSIVSTPTLPPAFTGEEYEFTHEALGGTAPYRWRLGSAAPSWLRLGADTGYSEGEPDGPGELSFAVFVQDAAGAEVSQAVTLSIGAAVAIITSELPGAIVDDAYDTIIVVSGSYAPFTYTLAGGDLPGGVALATDGRLSGIARQAGSWAFEVQVTDAQRRQDVAAFALTVAPAETVSITVPQVLPSATVDSAYGLALAATGGTGTGFAWSIVGGALPAGMTLTAAGVLSGRPEVWGDFEVVVAVSDNAEPPHSTRRSLALAVAAPVRFHAARLPDATAHRPYAAKIPVSGSQPAFVVAPLPVSGSYQVTARPSTFTATGSRQPWTEDEREWALALDFAFPFGDHFYTDCRVGDNGYLVFGDRSPSPFWDANAAAFAALKIIAPLWTDLLVDGRDPGAGIFVTRQSDAVVVRWRGRDFHDPDNLINTAVTLHRSGAVTFHYGEVVTTNRVVIGLADAEQETQTLLYTHDWRPLAPDYVSGWSNHDDVAFDRPAVWPEWLQLDDGHWLSGLPPATGTTIVRLRAVDAGGNTAIADLSLTVNAYTIDLQPGWNLFAVPFTPAEPEVAQVFDDTVPCVWTWRDDSFVVAEELQPTCGYWVYSEVVQRIPLHGLATRDRALHLAAGWNLFGCLADARTLADQPFAGRIWRFDCGYVEADEIVPGVGYWGYCPGPQTTAWR